MSKNQARTFELFNFKDYIGPNPELEKKAVVFDFALAEGASPLPIDRYLSCMGEDLPQLRGLSCRTYGELLAQAIAELNKLEMDLPLARFSVKSHDRCARIAIETLHYQSTYGVIDCVWDWLEAISDHRPFDLPTKLAQLQRGFSNSIYGGPTLYSLLKAAHHRNIPTFYLPAEVLFQYGYGSYQVRGIGTTFNGDSHLDSDFTTEKQDCKEFLANAGFPVPKGRVAYSLGEAFEAIAEIGYPVAVKPVVGHKGIGVTANVSGDRQLKMAFAEAKEACYRGNSDIIIEQYLTGSDFRLLCVGGKFVAALERRPPYVIGDGESPLGELIERENATPARQDTPTSPLGKIVTDGAMEEYLREQGLSLDSIVSRERVVYLRKVANLSSGGVSVDVTSQVHPDNKVLAEDIACYFNLVCLGVDAIAADISKSWKEGNFGIIEVNSAPGVFMHLNPALGESVDVPSQIIDYLFPSDRPCRMPIVTFNRLERKDVGKIVREILSHHPHRTVGTICRGGIWLNHSEKVLVDDYNLNVLRLLRHPQLDILIAECPEDVFAREGMAYEGSNLIILDEPTEIEKILARDLLPLGTSVVKKDNQVAIENQRIRTNYDLGESKTLADFYLPEITRLLK